MADQPNLGGDGSSYFRKTVELPSKSVFSGFLIPSNALLLTSSGFLNCSKVILRDWWLIKCSKEFEGKQFGVAGTEFTFTASVNEKRAMRVFMSSPIINCYDCSTLEASNGVCIVLRGFLNKERVVKSGFNPEISREFIFGFPPRWEQICNDCFEGIPFSNDINTVPPSIIIDKARYSVLSPCKNTGNVDESRDNRSAVSETSKVKISNRDVRSGRFVKSIRLRSISCGKSSEEEEMNLELSKAENRSNDGDDHGSEAKSLDNVDDEEESLTSGQRMGEVKVTTRSLFKDLDESSKSQRQGKSKITEKAPKSDRSEDECVAMVNDDGCGKDKNLTTNDGDGHGSEGLDMAYEYEAFDNEVIVQGDSSKSNESEKTLENDGNVVELMNPTANDGDKSNDECVAVDNEAISTVDGTKESLTSGCGRKDTDVVDNSDKGTSTNGDGESMASELRRDGAKVTTRASSRSLFKVLDQSSSKSQEEGKPKKSDETRESDGDVAEPMNPTTNDDEAIADDGCGKNVTEEQQKGKGKATKRGKSRKKRAWKKSGKTRKSSSMNHHSISKVKQAERSLRKTIRKINFDVEVTPVKEAKKQKIDVSSSTASLKRSRSGRLLMSPLEFWRNEIPVYDVDRNLIEVKAGDGKSDFGKDKKMKMRRN